MRSLESESETECGCWGLGWAVRVSWGRVSVWEDEKVLEVTAVTATHSVSVSDAPELCA